MYTKVLRSDFAASVCQVPSNDAISKGPAPTAPPKATTNNAKKAIEKPVCTNSSEVGSKIKTKKLLLSETFMCSVEDFYNVRKQRTAACKMKRFYKGTFLGFY